MKKMPAFFISHGSPTTLIDMQSAARKAWQGFLKGYPTAKAFLIISAHWETEDLEVTATEAPEIIYDFHGFSASLYDVKYPVPGAPEVAKRVADLTGAKLNTHRGLDHGAWVPLKIMAPDAKRPVIQLSLPSHWRPEQLAEIGKKIDVLREEGVIIIASGALTHNLRLITQGETVADTWAFEFDKWFVDKLETQNFKDILKAREQAPHYQMNHPRDEHFLPIHFLMDLPETKAEIIHRGFEFKNLSMVSAVFS